MIPLTKFFVGSYWKWPWILSKDRTKDVLQTIESTFACSELDSGYHICNIVEMLHDCVISFQIFVQSALHSNSMNYVQIFDKGGGASSLVACEREV